MSVEGTVDQPGARPGAAPVWAGLAAKVPAVTAIFWLTKALTTAFGESTSDYLVHRFPPVAAVLAGFVVFCAALVLQLRARRYIAWVYWLAVAMVGVFGTMAADVLHVGLGVPYAVSTPLFAVVLAGVFTAWYGWEKTLSVHTIDTVRRELCYWAAVVTTFALGTAAGDLTATTLNLGYLGSGVLFLGLLLVPAIGYRWAGFHGVFAFWFAYVLTRPVGASFADWFGKPHAVHGLGIGAGPVALVLALAIACCVGYMGLTGAGDPGPERLGHRSGTQSVRGHRERTRP